MREIVHNQDHNFIFDMKSGLVVPRKTQEIEFALPPTKMRAKYTLTKRHAESGDVVQELSFYNLVLDTWLNTFGRDDNPNTYGFHQGGVQIGTGTTPPNIADTSLQALVATTTTVLTYNFTNSGAPNYVTTSITVYRFAQGVLNGTFTEIGLRRYSDAQTISRTLIKDGAGNPTSFPVTSIEILDVTVAIENWPPLTDATYDIDIAGSGTHSCITRAMYAGSSSNWNNSASYSNPAYGLVYSSSSGATAYSGNIGVITGAPSGNSATISSGGSGNSYSSAAYSNNSFQREASCFTTALNSNLSGNAPYRCVSTRFGGGVFQTQFTPAIEKDPTKSLSLQFVFPWNRKT